MICISATRAIQDILNERIEIEEVTGVYMGMTGPTMSLIDRRMMYIHSLTERFGQQENEVVDILRRLYIKGAWLATNTPLGERGNKAPWLASVDFINWGGVREKRQVVNLRRRTGLRYVHHIRVPR